MPSRPSLLVTARWPRWLALVAALLLGVMPSIGRVMAEPAGQALVHQVVQAQDHHAAHDAPIPSHHDQASSHDACGYCPLAAHLPAISLQGLAVQQAPRARLAIAQLAPLAPRIVTNARGLGSQAPPRR